MPAVSAQLNDFIMPASGPAPAASPRPSFLARIVDAFSAAGARQRDIEIGRLVDSHGGRLTDGLEREIERRFV